MVVSDPVQLTKLSVFLMAQGEVGSLFSFLLKSFLFHFLTGLSRRLTFQVCVLLLAFRVASKALREKHQLLLSVDL